MYDPKGPAVCAGSMKHARDTVATCPEYFPDSWLLSEEEDTGVCSKKEKGRGTVSSASDLKDQVPFACPAVQLWSSCGTDLPALPLAELRGRWERGA